MTAVFSRRLHQSALDVSDWNNTTILRGDVAAAAAMKAEPGSDLLLYGHGAFRAEDSTLGTERPHLTEWRDRGW
jgi:hypothetical protein